MKITLAIQFSPRNQSTPTTTTHAPSFLEEFRHFLALTDKWIARPTRTFWQTVGASVPLRGGASIVAPIDCFASAIYYSASGSDGPVHEPDSKQNTVAAAC